MNQSFYDEFNAIANEPYDTVQISELFIRALGSFVNFGLNIPILYIYFRNKSGEFRRAGAIFMAGMTFAHVFMGIVNMASFINVIYGHWVGGYPNCVFFWGCSAVSAAMSIWCSNFMIFEQWWTVIKRWNPWSSFVSNFAIVFVLSMSLLLVSSPFWNPDWISYPTFSSSRTYCVSISILFNWIYIPMINTFMIQVYRFHGWQTTSTNRRICHHHISTHIAILGDADQQLHILYAQKSRKPTTRSQERIKLHVK